MNISCTPPGGGTTGGSASGDLGGHSQTDAVDTGIGQNAQTVFRGGNGTDVQKNSLFLTTASTQNRGRSDMNAWLSLKTRGYSGGYGGAAYDFVAGVDYLVDADTLFGALIGLGQIDINDGVTQTSATSFAVGPYFARQFNGGLMDGFLTFARPRYTTTGGAFTSARTALGFTLTGTSFRGRDNIAPYFDFRAFYEEQPAYGVVAANNIRSLRATFGMTVSAEKPLPNSGLIPYFKLAADVKSTTTTASGTDSFVYGRIGVGVAGPFVGGNLVLDVDLGKVRSDTFDGGLRVNWTIHF
ncbi:MAG: hypothetical protein KDK00_08595 [Rhodobacteraceae bacterium]|nr:hypothetical protein [Paracoccaceae bacterium]